ncbi:hypothetical protein BDC45DRAFT_529713 [Circinella umbellata]|nr:hypothetical protein BDC45DRAFT_529713 [Circinella umbellata]
MVLESVSFFNIPVSMVFLPLFVAEFIALITGVWSKLIVSSVQSLNDVTPLNVSKFKQNLIYFIEQLLSFFTYVPMNVTLDHTLEFSTVQSCINSDLGTLCHC